VSKPPALLPVKSFAEVYADPEIAARFGKSAGRKVVGVLGGTVPVELITAAGAMPMRLRGDPALPTTAADVYMEPVHEGHLRSILERLLAGHFNYLDLIVIPRSSEGLLQFYYLVEHIRATNPSVRIPPFYLFDLLQTPFEYTTRYVRARIEELAQRLAGLTGNAVGADAIREAVARHNRARRLFQKFTARRRGSNIPGVEALKAAIAGQVLDVDAFAHLLEENLNSPAPEDSRLPRLMVKGSPHEHVRFYETVERLGSRVVAEDHDWGERLYDHLIEEDVEPIDALARHYQHHAVSVRQLPQAEQDARFLATTVEAKVDGVIFYLEENDDTLGWDYPRQKRLLDEQNVPSLLLTGEPYFGEVEETSKKVSDFLAELRGARNG